MLGKTVQSGKTQAPCYTVTGRSKIGSFHEDLQKVSDHELNFKGWERDFLVLSFNWLFEATNKMAFILFKHQKNSLKPEPKPEGFIYSFILTLFSCVVATFRLLVLVTTPLLCQTNIRLNSQSTVCLAEMPCQAMVL